MMTLSIVALRRALMLALGSRPPDGKASCKHGASKPQAPNVPLNMCTKKWFYSPA